MQKWEYCSLRGPRGVLGKDRRMYPVKPVLWKFTQNGLEITEIKNQDAAAVAKAIAKLGEEVWEMTGADSEFLYFKRPLQSG